MKWSHLVFFFLLIFFCSNSFQFFFNLIFITNLSRIYSYQNNYSFLFILFKIYCAIYLSVCLLAWFCILKTGLFFYLLCTVVCLTTHVNPWSQIGDKNRLIHESHIELQTMDCTLQMKINNHLHQPTSELVSMSLLQYLGLLWIKFSHCYKRRILIKQV